MGGRGASSKVSSSREQSMREHRLQANRNQMDKSIRSYEKQIKIHMNVRMKDQ